jgi:hypothetical protein
MKNAGAENHSADPDQMIRVIYKRRRGRVSKKEIIFRKTTGKN